MTAMLKPSNYQRQSSSGLVVARGSNVTPFAPPARSRRERQQQFVQLPTVPVANRVGSQTVRRLPNLRSTPAWLRFFVFAQQSSTVVSFFLVAGVLAVYSWTVYTQQVWSKEYEQLKTLQHTEQQLTEANEVLKNQAAQQAEAPESGLVIPDSSNTILLQPAPLRYPVRSNSLPPPQPAVTTPMGY